MKLAQIFFLVGFGVGAVPTATVADDLVRRQGRYVELVTDGVTAEQADKLVSSFDAAVPQWMTFWGVDSRKVNGWKVQAYLIQDKATFLREGLLPPHIPDFPFGYASGNSVWVLVQPSQYYTRHLLLHEGVHSFVMAHLGGTGPTWFMEGIAELLATHRRDTESIEINRIPARREDVPYWGRFKLMGQLREESRVPTIETVMRYAPSLTGDVATYGWSWAATLMLDSYPEYRPAMLAVGSRGERDAATFNRQLMSKIGSRKWPVLAARWRMLCHELDYGFDPKREQIQVSERDPLWDGKDLQMAVAADQGWQSPAVRFPPRTQVTIRPQGKVSLDTDPRPWLSGPQGVTIRYHRGRPLGQLLMCVLPNAADRGPTVAPLRIVPIDKETTVTLRRHCWVLFRANDSVADLANNSGHFDVSIVPSR